MGVEQRQAAATPGAPPRVSMNRSTMPQRPEAGSETPMAVMPMPPSTANSRAARSTRSSAPSAVPTRTRQFGGKGMAYLTGWLKAGGALDVKTEPPKSPDWLPDRVWLNCLALSRAVKTFDTLLDSLARNEQQWRHRCCCYPTEPYGISAPG